MKGIEGVVVIHNGTFGTAGDVGTTTVRSGWTITKLNLPLHVRQRRECGFFDSHGTAPGSSAGTTSAGRRSRKSR